MIERKSKPFNLAIVGHAQDKFTPETESIARDLILESILYYSPDNVVSGHCHLGGVDIYAEEIATGISIPTIIHKPKSLSWSGPGGYRDRNLLIAHDSSLTLVVVVSSYPSHYRGQRFKSCYHCHNRNPAHVKSGGCYTAWQSKQRKWIII
jgi:hypothetical protein